MQDLTNLLGVNNSTPKERCYVVLRPTKIIIIIIMIIKAKYHAENSSTFDTLQYRIA